MASNWSRTLAEAGPPRCMTSPRGQARWPLPKAARRQRTSAHLCCLGHTHDVWSAYAVEANTARQLQSQCFPSSLLSHVGGPSGMHTHCPTNPLPTNFDCAEKTRHLLSSSSKPSARAMSRSSSCWGRRQHQDQQRNFPRSPKPRQPHPSHEPPTPCPTLIILI